MIILNELDMIGMGVVYVSDEISLNSLSWVIIKDHFLEFF